MVSCPNAGMLIRDGGVDNQKIYFLSHARQHEISDSLNSLDFGDIRHVN
jgi:hypothetical protein